MANERGLGKGIIRLEGPALMRPDQIVLPGGLNQAAFEMVTGIRFSVSRSLSGGESDFLARSSDGHFSSKGIDHTPKNYADDWWGE